MSMVKHYTVIIGLLLSGWWLTALANESLLYEQINDNRTQTLHWSLTETEQGWRIDAREERGRVYLNQCLDSGETQRWQLNSNDLQVSARLVDGELILVGVDDGHPIQRSRNLDGLPWFQPLSFSLAQVLATGRKSVTFWTIRPDNLSTVRLRAEHVGRETMEWQGQRVEVERVRVRPVGLLSFAWQADYWFRSSDRRFMRYESGSGIPGVPSTRIELLGEAGD